MIRLSNAVCATAAISFCIFLPACSPDAPTAVRATPASTVALDRGGNPQPGVHLRYGRPVKVGNGRARTYVAFNAKEGRAPVEIGIALDQKVLDGLPTDGMMYPFILNFPKHSPAPYQFAELDWNPHGHEPPNIYTFPHFDFHFYTISLAERNSITPSDPQFAAKARNVPTGDFVPPFYIVPGDPAAVAVPQMGVHWSDVRSPELQGLLGHPENYQQFTKTFIYGSWNGRYTFLEPMITIAYLQTHPNAVQDISVPGRYPLAGYYPTQYRVQYDAKAKEYRIALTGLVARQ